MAAGNARQPTTALVVKQALITLFAPILAAMVDPQDNSTVPDPPYFGAPGRAFGMQTFIVGGWTYETTEWADIGKKARTEKYAIHATFSVVKKTGSAEDATTRALELYQACDAALTAAPDLVTPLLGTGQQVFWVVSNPRQVAEGGVEGTTSRLTNFHVDYVGYARI